MAELRIFVNDRGEALFLCPRCGAENPVELEIDGPDEAEVSCACGHRERVLVDQRRAPRVTVSLSGEVAGDGGARPILIRVLSPLGLGFETPEDLRIEVGDEVALELFLEDVGAAVVRKTAVIRDVNRRFVGAEFHVNDPPTTYDLICDRALAVYLQGGDPDGF